jgi:hypothetical protein
MWKCKKCGEMHEDQFESCWKCDSYDGKEHFDLSLEHKEPDYERNSAKLLLSICSVIFGFSGLSLFVPLFFSIMAFDSPGSESNPIAWIIFLSLFTFAPMCLISIVVSWSLFSSGSFHSAKLVSLAPLLNVCLLVFGAILGSIFG